jgi:hypothetical protein
MYESMRGSWNEATRSNCGWDCVTDWWVGRVGVQWRTHMHMQGSKWRLPAAPEQLQLETADA